MQNGYAQRNAINSSIPRKKDNFTKIFKRELPVLSSSISSSKAFQKLKENMEKKKEVLNHDSFKMVPCEGPNKSFETPSFSSKNIVASTPRHENSQPSRRSQPSPSHQPRSPSPYSSSSLFPLRSQTSSSSSSSLPSPSPITPPRDLPSPLPFIPEPSLQLQSPTISKSLPVSEPPQSVSNTPRFQIKELKEMLEFQTETIAKLTSVDKGQQGFAQKLCKIDFTSNLAIEMMRSKET
jgi:hypothetical protein